MSVTNVLNIFWRIWTVYIQKGLIYSRICESTDMLRLYLTMSAKESRVFRVIQVVESSMLNNVVLSFLHTSFTFAWHTNEYTRCVNVWANWCFIYCNRSCRLVSRMTLDEKTHRAYTYIPRMSRNLSSISVFSFHLSSVLFLILSPYVKLPRGWQIGRAKKKVTFLRQHNLCIAINFCAGRISFFNLLTYSCISSSTLILLLNSLQQKTM